MNGVSEKKLPNFDLSAFNLPQIGDTFPSNSELTPKSGDKFIVFFVEDDFFAVPAANVAEVVQPLPLTTLQNIPDWILGLANLRGNIISVVNLRKLLNKTTSQNPAKPKFVILRSTKDDSLIAITADKLSEIVTLSGEEIQDKKNDKLFSGTALHKENTLHLLDTEKLYAMLTVS